RRKAAARSLSSAHPSREHVDEDAADDEVEDGIDAVLDLGEVVLEVLDLLAGDGLVGGCRLEVDRRWRGRAADLSFGRDDASRLDEVCVGVHGGLLSGLVRRSVAPDLLSGVAASLRR